jgi:hypothetical protein
MKPLQWTAPLAIAVWLLPACQHSDRAEVQPPATNVSATAAEPDTSQIGATNMQGTRDDDASVERIAAARCTHEQACGNVGVGQGYGGAEVCHEHMRDSIRDDLGATSCSYGIDHIALEDCLSAIDAEGCADGVATTHRARKCRADVLCVR